MTNCSFKYIDCGSVKPIHYKANEKVSVLIKGSNLPIGIDLFDPPVEFETSYSRGDTFVFCSDGVTETVSLDHEYYGIDRLRDLVEGNPNGSAAELTEQIRSSIREFGGKHYPADDLTIIVIRIN